MKEKIESHESYGLISITRQQCGERPLFGSSIKHSNTIVLKIKTAEKHRDLNRDWYFGREDIVEVEMSQTQFAEAITGLNLGSGWPVTIRRVLGKDMSPPPESSKRLEFEKEFKEKTDIVSENISKLTQEFKSAIENKATKKQLREFATRLEMLTQEIQSNMPFVNKQFNAQMDKTVKEAKGEIEAFTIQKITQLGINSLKELQQKPVDLIENED